MLPDLSQAGVHPPVEDGAPVFREPWEAQAFAMTLALHTRGVFTWKEWAAALATAIRDAQAAGDADTGETYYGHWLTALERITVQKRIVTDALRETRKAEWEAAARRTPHGEPIRL